MVFADWGNEANSGLRGGSQTVDVTVEGVVGAGLGLLAGAAEFGVGAVPGALESGDLALHAGEEFGGGEVGEESGGERGAGSFGEQGAVKVGLDALEAALLPVGTEHGVDVEVSEGDSGRKSRW